MYFTRREVRKRVAEALCETMLLTAEPQLRTSELTITAGETFQELPAGVMAIVRLEGARGEIKKDFFHVLDRMNPKWQQEEGDNLKLWMPLGLGPYFAVYPKLREPLKVIANCVSFPVTDIRPYDGEEPIFYQTEYHGALEDYATHMCRLKEGGAEFQQSIPQYDNFLRAIGQMASFGDRKSIDRFSRSAGVVAKVNDVETK